MSNRPKWRFAFFTKAYIYRFSDLPYIMMCFHRGLMFLQICRSTIIQPSLALRKLYSAVLFLSALFSNFSSCETVAFGNLLIHTVKQVEENVFMQTENTIKYCEK